MSYAGLIAEGWCAEAATGISPDSAPGATDDLKFQACLTALAATGGVIRLTPGTTYTWVNPIPEFNFATNSKPIIIIAFGAIVNCNNAAAAFPVVGPSTSKKTLTVFGGIWANTLGDFFRVTDLGNCVFDQVEWDCPLGSGVLVRNVAAFSERNSFFDCKENGCLHAITWRNAGGAASFARTTVRNLQIQGGTAANAKLNIEDNTAVYASLFDGVSGNIFAGVDVFRIAGNMNGTTIQGNIAVEDSADGGPCYYFLLGTITGGKQASLLVQPSGTTVTLLDPASGVATIANHLNRGWGVNGIGTPIKDHIAADVALASGAFTTVLTTPSLDVGTYMMGGAITCEQTTASLGTEIVLKIVGNTATVQQDGSMSGQATISASAVVAVQTGQVSFDGILTVTVAGTVDIQIRANQATTNALSKTAQSAVSNASGYTLLPVA